MPAKERNTTERPVGESGPAGCRRLPAPGTVTLTGERVLYEVANEDVAVDGCRCRWGTSCRRRGEGDESAVGAHRRVLADPVGLCPGRGHADAWWSRRSRRHEDVVRAIGARATKRGDKRHKRDQRPSRTIDIIRPSRVSPRLRRRRGHTHSDCLAGDPVVPKQVVAAIGVACHEIRGRRLEADVATIGTEDRTLARPIRLSAGAADTDTRRDASLAVCRKMSA